MVSGLRSRTRSGRLLILAVLVVVAVVLPAGAALLDRRDPATRLEPRTPPSSASTAARSYPPGTPAPALRLPGLDGPEVDLAALWGHPVVVNFWATWCDPCVREFPLLRQAAATHRPDRLAVIGVLSGDTPAAARPFVRRHDATWPMALDPNTTVATSWGAFADAVRAAWPRRVDPSFVDGYRELWLRSVWSDGLGAVGTGRPMAAAKLPSLAPPTDVSRNSKPSRSAAR